MSNIRLCTAAAVCLFLASPLIEMVLCLLSRVERAYPIRSYPFVILCVASGIYMFITMRKEDTGL